MMTPESMPPAALQTYPSRELLDYWNQFATFARGKGATVYMSCPPILNRAIGIDLVEAQRMLEGGLDFPVISRFEDYLFPPEYFYDTALHLTDKGTAKRTGQLIEDLRTAMGMR